MLLFLALLSVCTADPVLYRPDTAARSASLDRPAHTLLRDVGGLGVDLELFATGGRWAAPSLTISAGHRGAVETLAHREGMPYHRALRCHHTGHALDRASGEAVGSADVELCHGTITGTFSIRGRTYEITPGHAHRAAHLGDPVHSMNHTDAQGNPWTHEVLSLARDDRGASAATLHMPSVSDTVTVSVQILNLVNISVHTN